MKNLPFLPVTAASRMSKPSRASASVSTLPLMTYWLSGSTRLGVFADAGPATVSPTTASAAAARAVWVNLVCMCSSQSGRLRRPVDAAPITSNAVLKPGAQQLFMAKVGSSASYS